MSWTTPLPKIYPVEYFDTANLDAAGNLRTAEPNTIFESKLLFDADPLIWDDVEVSGSGTTNVHSVDTASTILAVSAATAGKRVNQTFQRFNYQAGKSQKVIMTGVLDNAGGGAGIIRRLGIFDDDNGLFFEDNAGTYRVVRRTNVTGTPVDNAVAQSSWNIDKFDGAGPSKITIDFTKLQVFLIDFLWLGGDRARMGFKINGRVFYAHQFVAANTLDAVYMSTPNLPLRYDIENTGAGAVSSLEHICTSVISEGGFQDIALARSTSTAGTHVDANAIGTLYAVIGLRLKSTHFSAMVRLARMSMLAKTNDDFEWSIVFNPTVAGTFTYNDETNSPVQVAKGATANTVTAGYLVDAGFTTGGSAIAQVVRDMRSLGSSIAGVADTIVLCARPFTANLDIEGALTWLEVR